MDHDRPAQQVRALLLEKEEGVDRIKRRAAGDIDEMQGRCAGESAITGDGLGHQGRHLLHAQAQERDMRRDGKAPVGGRIEGRNQIVGTELHHIGADAVEIGCTRSEQGGGEP